MIILKLSLIFQHRNKRAISEMNESQSLFFSISLMKIFSQSQFLFPFVSEKQQEISSKKRKRKRFSLERRWSGISNQFERNKSFELMKQACIIKKINYTINQWIRVREKYFRVVSPLTISHNIDLNIYQQIENRINRMRRRRSFFPKIITSTSTEFLRARNLSNQSCQWSLTGTERKDSSSIKFCLSFNHYDNNYLIEFLSLDENGYL